MKQFGGYIRISDSVSQEEIEKAKVFRQELLRLYEIECAKRDRGIALMLKRHKPISLEGY